MAGREATPRSASADAPTAVFVRPNKVVPKSRIPVIEIVEESPVVPDMILNF